MAYIPAKNPVQEKKQLFRENRTTRNLLETLHWIIHLDIQLRANFHNAFLSARTIKLLIINNLISLCNRVYVMRSDTGLHLQLELCCRLEKTRDMTHGFKWKFPYRRHFDVSLLLLPKADRVCIY